MADVAHPPGILPLPQEPAEGTMTIDERARHALHVRLGSVLGEDEAVTLMSHLPPVGWADVATKRDLDQLSAEFRAELHREVGGLRTELHREVGGLRAELQQQIGDLRADAPTASGR